MLREHVVGNGILLPGVMYAELALSTEVGSTIAVDVVTALSSIAFVRPCVVSGNARAVELFTMRHVLDSSGRFDIASHQTKVTDAFIVHAVGTRVTSWSLVKGDANVIALESSPPSGARPSIRLTSA